MAVASENTKLLSLAEQVAHFGSWQLDTAQTCALWSPGMFRVFGVKPTVPGLGWEEYTSYIHPQDREAAMKNAQTMFNSPLNHREEFDYRIIRPDGSVRHLHSQRQVVQVTGEGKAKVVVGVDQDVTEQWEAEEALRKSMERFRAVAEAANVMVYEYDLQTHRVQAISGEETVTGFNSTSSDLTIDWVMSRIHPDDVKEVVAQWRQAASDPNIDRYSLTYRFRHKNGVYIVVKDTAKAIKDQTGKTVHFVGGIRDITQRTHDRQQIEQYSRRLEELVEQRTRQLVEYERLAAIGQMAGMVGHDIRNPLQALTGDVYLIKTEAEALPQNQSKQEIFESLASIEANITYINKIVADLQDYSRKLSPEYQQVNLESLILEVMQTVLIPENIKIAIHSENLPNISVDPTFLRRTLTNLINNAIQAMPSGGELGVTAHKKPRLVCITVADTGVGIPPEVQAKLFTPMYTTKAKGQGLGLAVVKRLVEAQGGTISFQSKVGVGTKFFVELPLERHV
ncbi:MAG: PAS domain-containing protein [Candidatus Bathyarchaeota archaeon]|nr:PAS domain-containing protein [Candidatus Bathyarchaeota archaeon]